MAHEKEKEALALAMQRWIKDRYGFDAKVSVTDNRPRAEQLFPYDLSQCPERFAADVKGEEVWYEWLRLMP